MKVFQIKNGLIAISQIEIYGLNNTLNAGQIKKGLNRICEEMSLRYAVFNGVDIKEKTSVIIFSEGLSDKEAGRALGYKVIDGICVVDRIVLRKTELLPALLSV